MITDPIADTLTRIRNALLLRHKTVQVKHSGYIRKIILLLFQIGYIKTFRSFNNKYITVFLKYNASGLSVIHGIKRISKPGLRIYCKITSIPIIYNGIGTAIISTSKGLVTTYIANKIKIGGEIICIIW